MEYKLKTIAEVLQKGGLFQIVMDPEYRDGLIELEGFSYIQVLWWAHQTDSEEMRKLLMFEKPYCKGPEKVGVFATRSPVRPNPVAVTAVSVISIDRDRGIITVPYIDADPGTPVLDIKPYHPCTERVREVSVPAWCNHWPEWLEDSADFPWEEEFNF